jgi:8-oxo-dGTP diphosphatase
MPEPKHVVGAEVVVVNDENKLLLIKNPRRGWELPGGGVEKGEAIKAAAVREVKEETGIDVELLKFCGVHQNLTFNFCNNIFIGKPIGGKLTTSSESIELGYYTLSEALDMIDRQYLRERIFRALDESTHPFLLEYEVSQQ